MLMNKVRHAAQSPSHNGLSARTADAESGRGPEFNSAIAVGGLEDIAGAAWKVMRWSDVDRGGIFRLAAQAESLPIGGLWCRETKRAFGNWDEFVCLFAVVVGHSV